MYGKKEIRKLDDIKGLKVRVQATATEDTMFPAYGAQTVHMPFGSVYTSLQTGVVDFARKQRQRLSRQQALRSRAGAVDDRARGQQRVVWVSDKLWQSLNAEQKNGCWRPRARSASRSRQGFRAGETAAAKIEKIGVKIVEDVDKASFQKIADPYLDKLARDLGPHADKIKTLIRAIN